MSLFTHDVQPPLERDLKGISSAKSTSIEFLKRGYLVCVTELLASFLKFLEIDELTEADGGSKKFVIKNLWGRGKANQR